MIDTARSHEIYIQLMRAVTTARQPPEQVQAARVLAAERPADDRGYEVLVARATVQYHRDWIAANEERTQYEFDEQDLPTFARGATHCKICFSCALGSASIPMS